MKSNRCITIFFLFKALCDSTFILRDTETQTRERERKKKNENGQYLWGQIPAYRCVSYFYMRECIFQEWDIFQKETIACIMGYKEMCVVFFIREKDVLCAEKSN